MLFNKGPRDTVLSDKPLDAPAPVVARPGSQNSKQPAGAVKPPNDDRYAALLKRIDDLETVHAEDKKNHLAQVDRYKSELARLTRTHGEQTDALDKLQKRHDAYERRVQELHRASAAEQAEIKALRTKLRASEHAQQQQQQRLAKRDAAEERGEVKKAAAEAEARRREEEERKERDRRVAELEKTVAAERRRREMLEASLDEVRRKAEEEGVGLRDEAARWRQQCDAARREGEEARDAAEDREEDLVCQLERCKVALGRVAEEYARLASATVPADAHATLKEQHLALRYRSLRLERKLANSEGQVTELAHLIRRVQEENQFLVGRLQEAEKEIAFYSRLGQEKRLDSTGGRDDDMAGLEGELAALRLDIAQGHAPAALVEYHDAAHGFYRHLADDMQVRVDELENAALRERSANRALAEEVADHAALRQASTVELQRVQTALAEAHRGLADERASLVEMRRSRDDAQAQVNEAEKQTREQASQHKAALQRERDAAQKLSMQLGMSKTAEEALQEEIDKLSLELTDASRFQDAYYKLLDETEGLLARNDLAEEEAERLSRFNAEILGHQNPAQRIVYVDRIRRELADTKQTLLACTRERDALAASNDELRHEIDMYKSSGVPMENKPRSLFVRVSRPPLTNQSLNARRSQSPAKHAISEHLPGPGDMTLDELT